MCWWALILFLMILNKKRTKCYHYQKIEQESQRPSSVEFQSIYLYQKPSGDHLQIRRMWSILLPLQLTIQKLCLVELIQLILIKTLLFKRINSTYKAAFSLCSCRTHRLKSGKQWRRRQLSSNARPLIAPGEGSKPRTCRSDQLSPLKPSALTRKEDDNEKTSGFEVTFVIENSAFSITGTE